MRPHRGKYGNAGVTKGGILPIYLIVRCDFVVQGKTLAESLQSRKHDGDIGAEVRVQHELGRCYASKPFKLSISQLGSLASFGRIVEARS